MAAFTLAANVTKKTVRGAYKYLETTLSREYPKLSEEWEFLVAQPGAYERLHGDSKSFTRGTFSTQLTARRAAASSNGKRMKFFASFMIGSEREYNRSNLLFEIEVPTTDGKPPSSSAFKQALADGYKEATGDDIDID